MRREEYGDEEVHGEKLGGGDGLFRELDGEGIGDLVEEEFERPGSRAVACWTGVSQPCSTTLPSSVLPVRLQDL